MQVTVQRKWFTDLSTCGELYLDGVFECYTLEPPVRTSKPRAIPTGVYKALKEHSSHFDTTTIWIQHVLDFEDIEIHPGNGPADTVGCTVVGNVHYDNFVGNSRTTFKILMQKLPDEFDIEYIGDRPGDPYEREVLAA